MSYYYDDQQQQGGYYRTETIGERIQTLIVWALNTALTLTVLYFVILLVAPDVVRDLKKREIIPPQLPDAPINKNTSPWVPIWLRDILIILSVFVLLWGFTKLWSVINNPLHREQIKTKLKTFLYGSPTLENELYKNQIDDLKAIVNRYQSEPTIPEPDASSNQVKTPPKRKKRKWPKFPNLKQVSGKIKPKIKQNEKRIASSVSSASFKTDYSGPVEL